MKVTAVCRTNSNKSISLLQRQFVTTYLLIQGHIALPITELLALKSKETFKALF